MRHKMYLASKVRLMFMFLFALFALDHAYTEASVNELFPENGQVRIVFF